jgi:hypothetical protein
MKVGFTVMIQIKKQSFSGGTHKSPRVKKAQDIQSTTKSMLIVLFDVKGIVHGEFVPPTNMVNSDFYSYYDDLRCLRENV